MQRLFEELQTSFKFVDGDLFNHDAIVATETELSNERVGLRKITNFLYENYYSRSNSNSTGKQYTETVIENDQDLITGLSGIFPDKQKESLGWVVQRQGGKGTLEVLKSGITLTINPDKHLTNAGLKSPIKVGDSVGVIFSCHFPNISPGFYVFKSDVGDVDASKGIGRLYFNLDYDSAVDFSSRLLEILYKSGIRFDYKVFKNLKSVYRIDSAVLYFSLDDFGIIEEEVYSFVGSNSKMLNSETSEFHLRVSDGVGFAEEPQEKEKNESYGLNRCRILAQAIYDSFDSIKASVEIPLETFYQTFDEHNINWKKIYLNTNNVVNAASTNLN